MKFKILSFSLLLLLSLLHISGCNSESIIEGIEEKCIDIIVDEGIYEIVEIHIEGEFPLRQLNLFKFEISDLGVFSVYIAGKFYSSNVFNIEKSTIEVKNLVTSEGESGIENLKIIGVCEDQYALVIDHQSSTTSCEIEITSRELCSDVEFVVVPLPVNTIYEVKVELQDDLNLEFEEIHIEEEMGYWLVSGEITHFSNVVDVSSYTVNLDLYPDSRFEDLVVYFNGIDGIFTFTKEINGQDYKSIYYAIDKSYKELVDYCDLD